MEILIKNISKQYERNKFGVSDFLLPLENGTLGLLVPIGFISLITEL